MALAPRLRVGRQEELELNLQFAADMELAADLVRGRVASALAYWLGAVSLAGTPILRFEKFNEAAVHMPHPAIGGRQRIESFRHLARRVPHEFTLDNGWIRLRTGADLWNRGFDAGAMAAILDASLEMGRFDDECGSAGGDFGKPPSVNSGLRTSHRCLRRRICLQATMRIRSTSTHLSQCGAGTASVNENGR